MKNMITSLKVEPHDIKPGREISVHEYKVNNYNIHKVLAFVSRLMLASMENQSNNGKAELVPRDVSSLRAGWSAVKAAWQSAMDHNDPPSGAHELNYKVLLPTGVEIQKIGNFKMKVICMELFRLAEVMIACDSASSNGNIANGSKNDIETQMGTCESEMDKWIGTGQDNNSTGMFVPVFKHLGTLSPDVDLDYAGVSEPSPDAPHIGRPDVKDITGE